MHYQPLSGMRVVDLSRLLPGPYLTQLFADLGAEVIKVETPTLGDYARLSPPEMGGVGLFEAINRNKKSVAINYRHPRGRAILLDLCRTADMLLEGFRPGAMTKWKLGYADIASVKPDIIYCSLSGYGQAGPYRDHAGHDLNYTALSGALALNMSSEGKAPVMYGLPIADLSGAMLAAIAMLAMLAQRQRTGEGGYLDMALLDGVMSWVNPIAGGLYFNGIDPRGGTLPLGGGQPSYNVYQAADGVCLSLGALEPTFWSEFCQRADRAEWIPRQFDSSLHTELKELFLQKTSMEWLALFEGSDGCLERVNTFEEMTHDPHLRARGYVQYENDQPQRLNSPFSFARGASTAPPKLGEHTNEFLQSLGVDEQTIAALAEKGIVKQAAA